MLAAAAGLAAAFVAAPATAADMGAKPVYKAPPPVPVWSPWMIRVRALGVVTRNAGHVDQVPGSDLSTSDTIVPELDITYFFTPNIAAELILGVTRNKVTGTGAPATAGLDVGKAWLLPPTLTLQYHFTDFGAFKPYVGAGVNYTVFFDQSAGNTPNAAGVVVTRSDLKNTFGAAPAGRVRLHGRPALGLQCRRQEAVPAPELERRQQCRPAHRQGRSRSVADRRPA